MSETPPIVSSPRVLKSQKGPWLQISYPWRFEFNRIELPIQELHRSLNGLRILQLTDLHFRAGWAKPYDELIARVAADPPDLILFTGDLVEQPYNPRPAFAPAGRLVTSLPCKLGKFAILGNHDGDLVGPMWSGWGVTLINGQMATLKVRDATIELVGLPGVHRDDLTEEFISSIPSRTKAKPSSAETETSHDLRPLRIVLSHYPDAIRRIAPLHPDLVLAGHTHGGQLCLPGGIPLLTHDSLPRSMCKGLHRISDTWLVVGKGLGFSTWFFRTFCPAEVVEVTLSRA